MNLYKVSHVSSHNNVHTVNTFVVASSVPNAIAAFSAAWKKLTGAEVGQHHGTGAISGCVEVRPQEGSTMDVVVGE